MKLGLSRSSSANITKPLTIADSQSSKIPSWKALKTKFSRWLFLEAPHARLNPYQRSSVEETDVNKSSNIPQSSILERAEHDASSKFSNVGCWINVERTQQTSETFPPHSQQRTQTHRSENAQSFFPFSMCCWCSCRKKHLVHHSFKGISLGNSAPVLRSRSIRSVRGSRLMRSRALVFGFLSGLLL